MVNAPLRLALIASLCIWLTGCAELAFNLAGQALGELTKKAFQQAVQRTSDNPSQPPYASKLTQAERERCSEFTGKGIEVTESLQTAIPTTEGQVRTFEATDWWQEFEGETLPKSERRGPVIADGTFIITERSALLVPSPGTVGVRIPYDVVLTVELSPINPYSLTVISCPGRSDNFTFWQTQPNRLDPEAAAVAAAQLKARVAVFQATMQKQAESP